MNKVFLHISLLAFIGDGNYLLARGSIKQLFMVLHIIFGRNLLDCLHYETVQKNNLMHIFNYRANWCSIHGTQYKIVAVVHTGYTNALPKFALIKIVTVTNPIDLDRCLLFIVKDIPTLEYDSHTHSYKISRVEQGPPKAK